MAVFSSPGGKASSMPVGFIYGGVTSLIVTVVASMTLAWLVLGQRIARDQVGYGIMILLTVASFLGAKVSYGRIKRQRLAVSFGSGVIYLATLLSITALFFGGQYSGVGETALMIFCGCGLAVLMKKTEKRKQEGVKIRKGYR